MNDSLEEIEGYIKGENSVEYMKKHLQTRIKTGRDEDPLSISRPLPVCSLPQKICKMAEQYGGKMYLEKIFR